MANPLNPSYWFRSAMAHMVQGANERGEVIPRIKVFLERGGSLNEKDANGESLYGRAKRLHLNEVAAAIKGLFILKCLFTFPIFPPKSSLKQKELKPSGYDPSKSDSSFRCFYEVLAQLKLLEAKPCYDATKDSFHKMGIEPVLEREAISEFLNPPPARQPPSNLCFEREDNDDRDKAAEAVAQQSLPQTEPAVVAAYSPDETDDDSDLDDDFKAVSVQNRGQNAAHSLPQTQPAVVSACSPDETDDDSDLDEAAKPPFKLRCEQMELQPRPSNRPQGPSKLAISINSAFKSLKN